VYVVAPTPVKSESIAAAITTTTSNVRGGDAPLDVDDPLRSKPAAAAIITKNHIVTAAAHQSGGGST
tara:strand:+ start:1490 stop:1690 length:201 start_codon:yes stop_codon:yes gene_type:complete